MMRIHSEHAPRKTAFRGAPWIRIRSAVGLGWLLLCLGAAAQTPKAIEPAQSKTLQTRGPLVTDGKAIKLMAPDNTRGLPVMAALAARASTWEWSQKDLTTQDLSDLLWAANGVNRPGNRKRTAPSAVNAQDVDIYVFLKRGVYLYDATHHALNPVAGGDHRAAIDGEKPGSEPAALLILVSDLSRFRVGTPQEKQEWAAIDSGIVSQNISLFCAATSLGTRPRTDMDKDLIKRVLALKDTQLPVLNQAVGHPK